MAGQSIDPPRREDAEHAEHFHKAWNAADETLRQHVDEFVRRRLPLLWPGTSSKRNQPPPTSGQPPATDPKRPKLNLEVDRYERVNIDPTDRYVLSVPGSSRHRLRPDASGFDNLFLAGDWTGMHAERRLCRGSGDLRNDRGARAIGTAENIEIIGERTRR